MRVSSLYGAISIMSVALGVSLAGGAADAEQAAAAADAEAAVPAPKPGAPPARPRRGPSQLAERSEWWKHAREVLFRDIQLDPEQASRVDAIIESQRGGRQQLEGIRTELAAARKAGDAKRAGELQVELRKARAKLKSPQARIDEMRGLMSDAQRPTFDMNRAHLVAEGQQAGQSRQGRKARRPGEDAVGTGAEAQ